MHACRQASSGTSELPTPLSNLFFSTCGARSGFSLTSSKGSCSTKRTPRFNLIGSLAPSRETVGLESFPPQPRTAHQDVRADLGGAVFMWLNAVHLGNDDDDDDAAAAAAAAADGEGKQVIIHDGQGREVLVVAQSPLSTAQRQDNDRETVSHQPDLTQIP